MIVDHYYCYDVNNKFKELYNKNIHYDWIIKNDQLLICSSNTTIKITILNNNKHIYYLTPIGRIYLWNGT